MVRGPSKLRPVWSSNCVFPENPESVSFAFCFASWSSRFLGVALDAPAAEPPEGGLALYGSRPDLPSNVIVDEVIRSTLERELGPRLDFYAEFLDTARWPEGEAQIAVHDFLRRKYAQRRFSVIIAVARPAINFLRIYGDELFPGVPIVAYGDWTPCGNWEPGRPITGTLAKIDPSANRRTYTPLATWDTRNTWLFPEPPTVTDGAS